MADALLLEGLTAAHPAVGDLPVLLGKLRRLDRLAIGTERAQHAAALLQRLAAAGIRLDDVDAAAAWLGPVLCVSARDRRALLERMLREAAARDIPVAATPRVIGDMPLEAVEAAAQRAARRPWVIAIATAAALIVVLVVVIAGFGGTGTPLPFADGPRTLAIDWEGVLSALPVLGALLVGLGLFVAQRLLAPPPPILIIPRDPPPTGQGLAWFDEGALQAPLRLMGRQRRGAGRHLDLVETLRRTVRRAGWPTLIRGGRPRTPEHVMLVEVAGADDPHLLAAAAVLDRLRGADLRVTAYVCAGGFASPRPWTGGASVPLARVAALHRGARLLLVSDGETLHDAFANRLAPPAGFESFAVPVLVTPVPRTEWSWREAAFDRAGWRLAELSTGGLVDLARWLSGPRESMPLIAPTSEAPASFAALLARDLRLFRDDAGLPPELRRRLLDKLALHLAGDPRDGTGAFDLLRVLAMGASLTPATVERVAAHLASLDGPRAEEGALHRLLELPWFARGRLPRWLREDLLHEMPAALATPGRAAWLLHLADQPIGKGALSPAQIARLVAESRRAVALSPQVDATMRHTLALDPPARDVGTLLREGGLALAIAGGCAVGLWALVTLAPTILAAGAQAFAPFAFATTASWPWLGMLGIAVAANLFVMRGLGPRTSSRVVIFALGGVAILIALGPVWLFVAPGPGTPPSAQPAEASSGAALVAVIGLLVLLAVMPSARPGTLPFSALLARGNPWWAVPIMAGLVIMALSAVDPVATPEPLASWLSREAGAAMGALFIALSGHGRLNALGLHDPVLLRRAAVAFVAGQAVGGAIVAVVAPIPAGEMSSAAFGTLALLTRVLAGGASAVWVMGVAVPVTRLAAVAALGAVVAGVVAFGQPIAQWVGGPRSTGSLVAFLIPLPLIATWILCPPPRAGRWLWLALIIGGAALGAAAILFVGETTIGALAAACLLPYALTQPLLRTLRPELFAASDGLWRRCLLLIPCWFSFSVLNIYVGPFPLLAIPIAAWIASLHGPRALPAIALALAPLAIVFDFNSNLTPDFAFGLAIGGGLGHLLAALLVARFVADRVFREACLGATTLRRRDLVILAMLPLAYASPRILGFLAIVNLWPLVVTLTALIGLSRIPLRAPMLALAGSTLIAFIVTVAMGSPLPTSFGRFFHGMRNFPSDIVTLLLGLGLFRMLRGGAGLATGGALIESLRSQPAAFANTMAVVAFLGSVTLVVPWTLFGTPEHLSLLPFVTTHFLLATIFWAARGTRIDWNRLFRIPGGDRLPWPVALATIALAVSLMPAFEFELGVVQFRLFGRSVSGAIAIVAAVWLYHRLGQGLARLVPSVPDPEQRQGRPRAPRESRETPEFEAPAAMKK